MNLELELVESVASRKSPRGLEVFAQVVDLLDGSDESVVNRLYYQHYVPYGVPFLRSTRNKTHLLLRLLCLWHLVLLLTLSKELSLLVGLDTLGLGEESVVDGFGNGNGSNVDLGRGSDNVGLVDSSEGNTIEPDPLVLVLCCLLVPLYISDSLERTGNEQETRVELLKEDDPLSAVLSAEQDQDGSGGDGLPQCGLGVGLSGSLWSGNILGWVVLGSLRGRDLSLSTVGLSTDSLLSRSRSLGLGGSCAGLLAYIISLCPLLGPPKHHP
jgi:hypothetical protein